SPDGRFVVYTSDESGQYEIYVRPIDSAGRWQISTSGGHNPRWALANEILYQSGTNLMSASVSTSPSFTASPPVVLLKRNISDYDVAHDGRMVVADAPDASQTAGQLNVVINWFEDLKAKLPQ